MSAPTTTRVWEHSKHTGSKLVAMLAIADDADSAGVAWPGMETLRNRLRHKDQRSVIAVIKALEKSGELYVHRRKGTHNVYVVRSGMTAEMAELAARTLNSSFPLSDGRLVTAEMVLGVEQTPDQTITGDQGVTGDQTITGKTPKPVISESGGSDQGVTRSKDSVVVGKNNDPDPLIQQQQEPPPPPPRYPIHLERELFSQLRIKEAIWRLWMHNDAITVIAAFLHVTNSEDVKNPPGLMRAMLERGTSAPAQKFIDLAQLAVEHDTLDIDEFADIQRRHRYISGEFADSISS